MNPYLIDAPAVVSFSGGRTSGFMLRKIIDAFGGTLPDDVRVCFANTGLEHPKTYEFVEAVERNWNVPIHWLEYQGPKSFRVVRPDKSSRRGEPFETLIAARKYLPNPVARICTSELKVLTIQRYMTDCGFRDYTNAIGLRHDEPRRVSRVRGSDQHRNTVMPMADAYATIDDVAAFWAAEAFDLELPGGTNAFGNCVGCFLKGRQQLLSLMRLEPQHFDWWVDMEVARGASFRSDRPRYIDLLALAKSQGLLFSEWDEKDNIDCSCTD